ncbi:aldehyde dehydrogenase family protein [Pelagibius sp.]|uniref:aldehyde dehydrogenase family protein n=1 Tax=Pelagibius sp. TaxID=1931238 RepID=UPI00260E6123|nr:aldehyde dehydrogenase family protein [Pelagibius sp.]
MNYVGGVWTDGLQPPVEVEDPATGQVFATIARAGPADVDRAVAGARACHLSGALTAMRPVERGRMVRRIGDRLAARLDEVAAVLSRETGKPKVEARIEVEGAVRYFEYYGNQAETLEGRSIPLGDGYYDFTVMEPYGVSAQIIPWNYPVEMTARSLSAALTAGNACVVKTPELTPLSSLFIAEAVEAAGLPAGAVSVLCGYGHEAGAALSSHPDVDQIVFTGSVETGTAIMTAAAKTVIPTVMELGGKSAAIAYPDADLAALDESLRWGIYFNAGQVCSAMSRLIVHRSIHDEVVDRARALAQSLRVGAPDEDADMGPMISEKQRERAEGLCRQAQQEGASLVTGGHRLNRPGWFLEPTIFANVAPEMTIAQTEVFGPVLSVFSFEDEAEAIRIANATDYGLVAGVFTRDLDRAMTAARHLKAGQIFVNEWYAGGVETPFGGYGKSGFGREKGREALWNYLQTKNIAIRTGT